MLLVSSLIRHFSSGTELTIGPIAVEVLYRTNGFCLQPIASMTYNLQLHLGALKTLDRNEEGRVIQNTTTIIIHPDYYARVLRNDIALLRLDKPVTFSDIIQPVRLPQGTNNRFQRFPGVDAIATGFGYQNKTVSYTTPILQWTGLPYTPLVILDAYFTIRLNGLAEIQCYERAAEWSKRYVTATVVALW